MSAIYHFRPLSMGQLLDRAFRLYRKNFLTHIGIIALMLIPLQAAELAIGLLVVSGGGVSTPNPSTASPVIGLFASLSGGGLQFVMALLTYFLVNGVATAALVNAVSSSYAGEGSGILQSYRNIGRRWSTLLAALLLNLIVLLLIAAFTIIPCIGNFSGPGALFFYLFVVTPLVAPVVVMEGHSVSGSLRRAWDLTRRRFWWLVGLAVVLYTLAQIVVAGPTLLAAAIFTGAFGEGAGLIDSPEMALLLQSIVELVSTLLYMPLLLSAITLVYFDLRIRYEGFDLQLAASHTIEQEQFEFRKVVASSPAPERSNLVTWTELLFFASLTIGAFVALVLLYTLLIMLGMIIFLMMMPGF